MAATVIASAIPELKSAADSTFKNFTKMVFIVLVMIGFIVLIFSSIKVGFVLLMLGGGGLGMMYYMYPNVKSGGYFTSIRGRGEDEINNYIDFANYMLLPNTNCSDVGEYKKFIKNNSNKVVSNYKELSSSGKIEAMEKLQKLTGFKDLKAKLSAIA